jgi:hypothetical protein
MIENSREAPDFPSESHAHHRTDLRETIFDNDTISLVSLVENFFITSEIISVPTPH